MKKPDFSRTQAALVRAFENTPQAPLISALWKDFASIPGLSQIITFPHILMMFAITNYFNEDKPVTLEALQVKSEENDSTRLSPAEENKIYWRKFFHAARKVNPFYVIPVFFFVLLLASLHAVSDRFIKTPIQMAYWNDCYTRMAKQFGDPRWIRDYALDVRPFLTWFCLIPPITLTLMSYNWLKTIGGAITGADKRPKKDVYGIECTVLRQRVDKTADRPKEFYNSAWFNVATLTPYLLGIPTIISLWIYSNLGVDPLLGNPSTDPKFHTIFPNIMLYIYGLAACLSVLFFRSYFTFCWNFTSTEFEIEIYPDMIKRLPIKGWFFDFMSFAGRQPGTQIRWQDVTAVKYSTARLNLDKAKRENTALTILRKISSIYESVAQKLDIHSDTLEISTDFGKMIEIRLWELSTEQKLHVFQALRKYCPSVYLDEAVQKALVGSSVMREPKYTEIWFEVLSGGCESRDGDLAANQELNKGKYKITSKLASGGQAVLYNGTTAAGEIVVLKEFQLTPGESFDAKIESAKDFENESAILGLLSHETIVKMLDMFYESGRVYLVLEHVEGRTLRQVLAESGPMDATKILDLANQMCSILEYLHSQEPPVVHRDFTPDNIILQPNGKLKLIDFSVAQRKLNKASGDCAGKHAYTPPEQFAGEACPQSDIYALGATLYFLATGKDPVPITNSSLAVDEKSELMAVSNIISKCTKLDLDQRYESVEWLATEIGHFLPAQVASAKNDESSNDGEVIELKEKELAES